MKVKKQLWKEYRDTWSDFSIQLQKLQNLSDSPDHQACRDAFSEVENSRMRHNAARDRLAEHLAEGLLPVETMAQPAGSDEHRIRGAARLIWEFSGKPGNTADSDWHEAEQLVRTASA
jgi:hypothetical protein